MGEWRKLHNEELHKLFSLPDIIGTMESMRLRYVGNVSYRGDHKY
jgi:hypothetical protein